MLDASARRRGLLLCAGIGLLGAAILALSAYTIFVFALSMATGAAVIVWDEGRWMALPLALAVLALALALFVGRNHGTDDDGPHIEPIKRLLIASFCLLLSTLVFPSSVHWLAGLHLEAGGYTPCGRSFWIAPDRMPDRESALARCEEWRRG
jgi:hypothetical protein